MEQPNLANTLIHIAEEGPDYFYETIAATLAAEVQQHGGNLTEQDIRGYQPAILRPLETDFMGHTYIGASGSSSGGLVRLDLENVSWN